MPAPDAAEAAHALSGLEVDLGLLYRVHAAGAGIFFVLIIAFSIKADQWGSNNISSRLYRDGMVIMTTAMLCYLGGAVFEATPMMVLMLRYTDWLITTPTFLMSLWRIGRLATAASVLGTMLADALMVACGFLCVLWPAATLGFWLLGNGLFFVVFLQLYFNLQMCAETPDGIRIFAAIQRLNQALWVLFPIVYATGPLGLQWVSFEAEAVTILLLDLCSKGGFTFLLSWHQPRFERMYSPLPPTTQPRQGALAWPSHCRRLYHAGGQTIKSVAFALCVSQFVAAALEFISLLPHAVAAAAASASPLASPLASPAGSVHGFLGLGLYTFMLGSRLNLFLLLSTAARALLLLGSELHRLPLRWWRSFCALLLPCCLVQWLPAMIYPRAFWWSPSQQRFQLLITALGILLAALAVTTALRHHFRPAIALLCLLLSAGWELGGVRLALWLKDLYLGLHAAGASLPLMLLMFGFPIATQAFLYPLGRASALMMGAAQKPLRPRDARWWTTYPRAAAVLMGRMLVASAPTFTAGLLMSLGLAGGDLLVGHVRLLRVRKPDKNSNSSPAEVSQSQQSVVWPFSSLPREPLDLQPLPAFVPDNVVSAGFADMISAKFADLFTMREPMNAALPASQQPETAPSNFPLFAETPETALPSIPSKDGAGDDDEKYGAGDDNGEILVSHSDSFTSLGVPEGPEPSVGSTGPIGSTCSSLEPSQALVAESRSTIAQPNSERTSTDDVEQPSVVLEEVGAMEVAVVAGAAWEVGAIADKQEDQMLADCFALILVPIVLFIFGKNPTLHTSTRLSMTQTFLLVLAQLCLWFATTSSVWFHASFRGVPSARLWSNDGVHIGTAIRLACLLALGPLFLYTLSEGLPSSSTCLGTEDRPCDCQLDFSPYLTSCS